MRMSLERWLGRLDDGDGFFQKKLTLETHSTLHVLSFDVGSFPRICTDVATSGSRSGSGFRSGPGPGL